ncbi:hypothetical protein VB735_18555 [Halotia wernerae UHCC 0503]|nr:hypothetical protein [Halotia wernerae UHCC 0503]
MAALAMFAGEILTVAGERLISSVSDQGQKCTSKDQGVKVLT